MHYSEQWCRSGTRIGLPSPMTERNKHGLREIPLRSHAEKSDLLRRGLCPECARILRVLGIGPDSAPLECPKCGERYTARKGGQLYRRARMFFAATPEILPELAQRLEST